MNPKIDSFISKIKKWQTEFKKLRMIILDCQLTEELKWGVPCYTLQEKNIAVYGSLDKVPDDKKAQNLQEILANAVYVTRIGNEKYDSDKAITFGDRDARLFESDDGPMSEGVIAILLDSNTIALIHASVNKEHLSGQEDAVLFDGRAWDIINTITVT